MRCTKIKEKQKQNVNNRLCNRRNVYEWIRFVAVYMYCGRWKSRDSSLQCCVINLDELKEKLWFELETIEANGEKNTLQIQLIVTE